MVGKDLGIHYKFSYDEMCSCCSLTFAMHHVIFMSIVTVGGVDVKIPVVMHLMMSKKQSINTATINRLAPWI